MGRSSQSDWGVQGETRLEDLALVVWPLCGRSHEATQLSNPGHMSSHRGDWPPVSSRQLWKASPCGTQASHLSSGTKALQTVIEWPLAVGMGTVSSQGLASCFAACWTGGRHLGGHCWDPQRGSSACSVDRSSLWDTAGSYDLARRSLLPTLSCCSKI